MTGTVVKLFRRTIEKFAREESIGVRGERLAARYLKQKGYRVVERNLRVGKDEADLVMMAPSDAAVVIVEVKTRRGSERAPELAVDRLKQHRLTRLAANLKKRPEFRDVPLRFDVITVNETNSGAEIRHFESAFDATL